MVGLDREQEGRGLRGKVGPGAGCLPLGKLALLRNSDLQVQAGLMGSRAAALNYPRISPKKHDCIILQRSVWQPTWCVRESKQLLLRASVGLAGFGAGGRGGPTEDLSPTPRSSM